MTFSRWQKFWHKSAQENSSSTIKQLSQLYFLFFHILIISSFNNSKIHKGQFLLVIGIAMSGCLNLVSLILLAFKRKKLFNALHLICLILFWIASFSNELNSFQSQLTIKLTLAMESHLYFLSFIILLNQGTKLVVLIVGFSRILCGLDIKEDIVEVVGVILFLISSILILFLLIVIHQESQNAKFLQQKEQLRYIDLENILNNDIQQGILIVTPSSSSKKKILQGNDLKLKYVNNCFLEQFNVTKQDALKVLKFITASTQKQNKQEQDQSYNDSDKNFLEELQGSNPTKSNIQILKKASYFSQKITNQLHNDSKEKEAFSENPEQEDYSYVSKMDVMRNSVIKKDNTYENASFEQNRKREDSINRARKSSLLKERIGSIIINKNNGIKDSMKQINLLEKIRSFHNNYLRDKSMKKKTRMESYDQEQLVIWEFKSQKKRIKIEQQQQRRRVTLDENELRKQVVNKQYQQSFQQVCLEQIHLNFPENNHSPLNKFHDKFMQSQSRTFTKQLSSCRHQSQLLNSLQSTPQNPSRPLCFSPTNQGIKSNSDQPQTSVDFNYNRTSAVSSEAYLQKNQMSNCASEKVDKEKKEDNFMRRISHVGHHEKLIAHQIDDNIFEIFRKERKSKTEIGTRKKLEEGFEGEDEEDEEEEEEDNDMQYLEIKLFECEMGKEESIMIVVNSINQRIKYERLKELQHQNDEMLANVTHDLKTPLNCMCLMAESMRMDKQYNELAISMILDNANLLMCLVQDILDYSQIKKGKLRLIKSTFYVTEIISEVVSLFQMQANQKNIKLLSKISSNFEINSDKNRIKQILINLVGNALKFTQEGYIEITCYCQDKASAKLVIFSVRDTGVGMSQHIKSQLFKKFNTFDQKGLNKNGTGLGLTICKRLVTFLGPSDKIEVQSEVSKGSVFAFGVFQDLKDIISNNRIISEEDDDTPYELEQNHQKNTKYILNDQAMTTINTNNLLINDHQIKEECQVEEFSQTSINEIPLTLINSNSQLRCILPNLQQDNKLKSSKLARINFRVSKSSPLQDTQSQPSKIHMLIVDDEPFNIAAFKLILKNYKQIQITEAYNGQDALEKYQKHQYKCILMDYSMPIMNGFEATKSIRQYEQKNSLKPTKIIIVSGFDDHQNQIKKTLQGGADDFITKPVNFKILFEKLKDYLK